MPDTEVRLAPAPAEAEAANEVQVAPDRTSPPTSGEPSGNDSIQEDPAGWLSLRKPQVNLHWHRRYVAEGTGE